MLYVILKKLKANEKFSFSKDTMQSRCMHKSNKPCFADNMSNEEKQIVAPKLTQRYQSNMHYVRTHYVQTHTGNTHTHTHAMITENSNLLSIIHFHSINSSLFSELLP